MWCQIFTEVNLRPISWISSPLLEMSRGLIWNAVPELYLMNEQVEFHQRLHFLYWPFYANMKNQHFYSWSCCYLGVLSSDLYFCPSECMLYECVTMNSLCVFTWKEKLPKDLKIQANASLIQLNQYVINPPWVWPAWIPKCLKVEGIKLLFQWWQRIMSQYSLLSVLMYFIIIYHPENLSVFSFVK